MLRYRRQRETTPLREFFGSFRRAEDGGQWGNIIHPIKGKSRAAVTGKRQETNIEGVGERKERGGYRQTETAVYFMIMYISEISKLTRPTTSPSHPNYAPALWKCFFKRTTRKTSVILCIYILRRTFHFIHGIYMRILYMVSMCGLYVRVSMFLPTVL